ncbi:MuF-C-terminal domain-containing protein [Ursidibacter arcticus]
MTNLKKNIKNFSSFIELLFRSESSQSKNAAFRFSTPKFLVENFDFPELEMYIDESTIRKIYSFHGVSMDFLKRIPELLNNFDEEYISYIFKSNTQENSSVVVSFEFVGQKPIIIVIAKNKQVNTNDFVNKISSVYEKDNAQEIFRAWEEKELLLYKNEKKVLTVPVKKTKVRIKKSRTKQVERKD